MNDALMDAAYSAARDSYKTVAIEAFKALDSRFGGTDFDTLHHAAKRAMRLHSTAADLAQKHLVGHAAI